MRGLTASEAYVLRHLESSDDPMPICQYTDFPDDMLPALTSCLVRKCARLDFLEVGFARPVLTPLGQIALACWVATGGT